MEHWLEVTFIDKKAESAFSKPCHIAALPYVIREAQESGYVITNTRLIDMPDCVISLNIGNQYRVRKGYNNFYRRFAGNAHQYINEGSIITVTGIGLGLDIGDVFFSNGSIPVNYLEDL